MTIREEGYAEGYRDGYFKRDEEIVRCKDCRFGEKSVSPFWKMFCNRHDRHVDSDDYCSNGERKDGDGNGRC